MICFAFFCCCSKCTCNCSSFISHCKSELSIKLRKIDVIDIWTYFFFSVRFHFQASNCPRTRNKYNNQCNFFVFLILWKINCHFIFYLFESNDLEWNAFFSLLLLLLLHEKKNRTMLWWYEIVVHFGARENIS